MGRVLAISDSECTTATIPQIYLVTCLRYNNAELFCMCLYINVGLNKANGIYLAYCVRQVV